jgi:hypothetical protein
VTGCADVDVVPGDTETDTEGTGTTMMPTADGSSESGPEPICEPGAVECVDEGTLQTCDEEGLAWIPEDCAEGSECVPCEGDACEAAAACSTACEIAEQTPSSLGCSFLASHQIGLVDPVSEYEGVAEEDREADGLVLVNPSPNTPANVQIYRVEAGSMMEMPMGDPITIAPEAFELVDLAERLPLGEVTTLRVGSLLRAQSDIPIAAFTHGPYRPFVGNDSNMLLPESALGTRYVVPSYPPHYVQFQDAGKPTYFDLVATADGTTIRWQAQFAATSGNQVPIDPVAAGEWSMEYPLARFQGVRVIAANDPDDMDHNSDVSGTVIEADAPVAVIGGSRCSAVPISTEVTTGCDPLQEVLIPLEQWGSTYVVPHPPLRADEDHYYRIYGEEGVMVTFTPGSIADPYTFGSRGEFIDVTVPNAESFVVEADGPIMPVGYLGTRDPDNEIGDPAMYQHVAVEQLTDRYVILAVPGYDVSYVQVTRTEGGADITIDGMAVTTYDPPVGGYESAAVPVTDGIHVVTSAEPFAAGQFAYVNSTQPGCAGPFGDVCHSSYAHPAGAMAAILNDPS